MQNVKTPLEFVLLESVDHLLKEHLLTKPGDADIRGNIIGQHQGLFFYTLKE